MEEKCIDKMTGEHCINIQRWKTLVAAGSINAIRQRGVYALDRSEVEAFFNQDDEDVVQIELHNSRTYIGYIHGWEKPPYEDWIYFQEEDDTSGRMPRDMIKSITWFHDET